MHIHLKPRERIIFNMSPVAHIRYTIRIIHTHWDVARMSPDDHSPPPERTHRPKGTWGKRQKRRQAQPATIYRNTQREEENIIESRNQGRPGTIHNIYTLKREEETQIKHYQLLRVQLTCYGRYTSMIIYTDFSRPSEENL